MLVTVEGIVIGRRDIGENNCFIDVLTNQFGVIEATAHGIKKTNSSNISSAGLFSYSKFCLNKHNLKYTLNSAQPKHSFFGLSSDITRFSLAAYLADIIKYTSTSEQNGEEILRFFAITLFELEKENADCEIIKAVFELRIASMLGFLPDLRACRGCGEYLKDTMFFSFDNSSLLCGDCEKTERKIGENLTEISHDLLHTLRYVVYSPVEKLYKFTLKGKTRKDFSDFSERYLLMQLDRGFKTLDYYKNIKG